ncbi:hypothetical protein GPECTOR_26g481 [Gonium pectorale]|uniref:FAD-binding domain-containing protein n=1 Tax=Gonium pectorale TaxID=33097 RepID=A0A150GFH0_GONPE|nr:hypothetical protein GPECTOR_26g481 [Gonium pectorale]|eukprot:KXZ48578.1 hypothetical protein GPECTOR_26g481 [Gonium pectorale]
MDRTLLATSLLEAARGQYGSREEFSFGSVLRDLELDRKVAVFGGEGFGSDLRVQYDMLIIRSGPSSGPDSGPGSYKAVYGMPVVPVAAAWVPDSSAPEADRTLGEFFFLLLGGSKGFMSVCKDIDDTFCGYLAGPESLWEGLRSREDYLAVLPSAAPQLPAEWLPLLADKLLEAPLSSFPVMRSLSRFWAPGGVVLLGDAAHTVTPALGQGLNSALQDCELLGLNSALQDCELLVAELRAGQAASSPESLDAALRRFSEARAPEIRALQELELLQSTSLARLNLSAGLSAVLPLLLRKWLVIHYSGLALVGTVVATISAEGRRKKRAEAAAAQAAGTGTGTAEARAAEAAAGASGVEAAQQAVADALGAQMVATYVRSLPMHELLRGHMGYRDMLTRLYGMAAFGIYGGSTAAAAAADMRAAFREEASKLLDAATNRRRKVKSFSSVSSTEANYVLDTLGILEVVGKEVAAGELQVPDEPKCSGFECESYGSEDKATPHLLQHHKKQLEILGVAFGRPGGFKVYDVQKNKADSLTLVWGDQTYRGIFDSCIAPFGLTEASALRQCRIVYQHQMDMAYRMQAKHLMAHATRSLLTLRLEQIPEEEQRGSWRR